MSGRKTTIRAAATVLICGVLAAVAVAVWSGGGGEAESTSPLGLERAAGVIGISNSLAGQAVLSAEDLVPGQSATGSVVIGNTGDVPMKLHLNGDVTHPGLLAEALRLQVARRGSSPAYDATLTNLDVGLGVLQPDQRRRYDFKVTLPPGADDSLQGTAASMNLIWKGKSAAPPPACRIRALRSRFFIFKRRHRIRMVLRYRSTGAAEVSLVFFERLSGNRRGQLVGGVKTRIGRAEGEWRLDRFARRRSEAALERLRRSRRGFIVQVRVAGAPDYCARQMNLVLTQLRRVDRQFVWFQRGSFRRLR